MTAHLVIYFITFACYGCHLHGNESGSVDRAHNVPGTRLVAADLKRVSAERRLMAQSPYCMDRKRRDTVLASLLERCSQRGWSLLAAQVRTNHVHIVVEGEAEPERIMNDLKSYASRCLNRMALHQHPPSGGRDMGVRGGCGSRKMCRRRSGMSLTSRVMRCLSLRRVCHEGNTPFGRGSVPSHFPSAGSSTKGRPFCDRTARQSRSSTVRIRSMFKRSAVAITAASAKPRSRFR